MFGASRSACASCACGRVHACDHRRKPYESYSVIICVPYGALSVFTDAAPTERSSLGILRQHRGTAHSGRCRDPRCHSRSNPGRGC
jgi:hypothetical protein